MPDRIPIPLHLGGGWMDDPGPAPLDLRSRSLRRAFRHPKCREYASTFHMTHGNWASPPVETWEAHEIEECARFARMRRDD